MSEDPRFDLPVPENVRMHQERVWANREHESQMIRRLQAIAAKLMEHGHTDRALKILGVVGRTVLRREQGIDLHDDQVDGVPADNEVQE